MLSGDCAKVQQKPDHFLIMIKFLLLETLCKKDSSNYFIGLKKNGEETFPKRF